MADDPLPSAVAIPEVGSAPYKALKREDVIAAYDALLSRPPESDDVVNVYTSGLSLKEMLVSITNSVEFTAQFTGNPFQFYASVFDAEEMIRRHAAPDLRPTPGLLTNYIGVKIDPKFLPAVLFGAAGSIEGVPIPANWHADIAEWAAALRAVELAQGAFMMAELGCGWGCWMNNTGVAARRLGLDVKLVGVEGDVGHLNFARESTALNGFTPDQVIIHHGIAASEKGIALFPRQDVSGINWGLEPVFGATELERQSAKETGHFDELPMIPIEDLILNHSKLDLLHIDIQGGELDIVTKTINKMNSKVNYIVIGTHSRGIEGKICDIMLSNDWQLEIERPAIIDLSSGNPITRVDGVQGWRNKRNIM